MDPNSQAQNIQTPPIINTALPETPAIPEQTVTQGPVESNNYPAPLMQRLSAVLFDSLILGAFSSTALLIIAFILNLHYTLQVKEDFYNNPPFPIFILSIIAAIESIIYSSIFISLFGATIGKKLYGLRVVDLNTSLNLSYPKAFLRESVKSGMGLIPIIGYLLSLANILIIIFSKTKQGLHDRLVNSQVIKVGDAIPLWKQVLLFLPLFCYFIIVTGLLILFVFNKFTFDISGNLSTLAEKKFTLNGSNYSIMAPKIVEDLSQGNSGMNVLFDNGNISALTIFNMSEVKPPYSSNCTELNKEVLLTINLVYIDKLVDVCDDPLGIIDDNSSEGKRLNLMGFKVLGTSGFKVKPVDGVETFIYLYVNENYLKTTEGEAKVKQIFGSFKVLN